MHSACFDVNVLLHPHLSYVQHLSDGTYKIIATVDMSPKNEEERSITQSAIHIVMLDEFTNEIASDKLDIHVIVSSSPFSLHRRPCIASQWIDTKTMDLHKWLLDGVRKTTIAAYHRIVDAYPWRDRMEMRKRIPLLITRNMDDAHVSSRNLDLILPPLSDILPNTDHHIVWHDATICIGRTPKSLLEVYEVAFLLVSNGCHMSRQMSQITAQIFIV